MLNILISHPYATLMFVLILLGSITDFATSLNTTSFRDLHFPMPYIEEQGATWTIDPLVSPAPSSNITTNCSTIPLLGGPGVVESGLGSYKKTYENIFTPYTSVFITLELMLIDRWSYYEFDFKINGAGVGGWDFYSFSIVWSNLCENPSYSDLGPFKVWLARTVTSSDSTISFELQKSGTGGQLAISNLNIALSNQTASSIAGLSNFPLANGYFCVFTSGLGIGIQCKCNLQQYYEYDTGTGTDNCLPCHSSCETCYGGLKTECVTCAEGYTYDGSVCIQCDSTCDACFGTDADQCSSCPGGSYLYPDSTCKSTCDASYTRESDGFRYCDIPDTPDTSDTPTTPNVPVQNSDATDDETPTQESSNVTLCTELNTYNYEQIKNETLYFYPDDSVCKTTCPSPYVVTSSDQNNTLCKLPLSQADRDHIAHLESTGAVTGSVMTAGLTVMTALIPSYPSSINVAILSKMFEYTKQFNVMRSPRLELYYKSNRASPATVKIGVELPEDVVAKITYHQPPSVFVNNNLHSSFLVNFFVVLQTLLIISAAILFLAGIEYIIKRKYAQLVDLCQKIIQAVVSFLTTQFYGIYVDILFFGTLQFMAFSIGTGLTWFGFFLSVMFYVLALSFLVLHAKLIKTYQKIKTKAGNDEGESEMKQFKIKYKKFEVLYKHLKDLSFIQQAFLLFLATRAAITGIVMSAFYNYPGVQIGFSILMNILTILYLAFKSPYKSLPILFQQIVYELDFILINICFVVISVLDVDGDNDERRVLLGDIVINSIVASKFIPLITIIPKVRDVIQEVIKVLQNRKKPQNNSEMMALETPIPASLKRREMYPPDEDQLITKEVTVLEFAKEQHTLGESSKTPENFVSDATPIPVNQEGAIKAEQTPDGVSGIQLGDIRVDMNSRSYMEEREDNELGNEGRSPIIQVNIRETLMK